MTPYLILIMLFVGIIGELIIRIFDIEVTLELLIFLLLLFVVYIFIEKIVRSMKTKKNIEKIALPDDYEFIYKGSISPIKEELLCTYKDGKLIATIRVDEDTERRDIERVIKRKLENYLKPVHQILREVSIEDVKREARLICVSGNKLSRYLGRVGKIEIPRIPRCNYNCDDCENIKDLYEDMEKAHEKLLSLPVSDSNKIIGLDRETFEDLSLEEIVSAKYKEPQCEYLGARELDIFAFRLLTHIAINERD